VTLAGIRIVYPSRILFQNMVACRITKGGGKSMELISSRSVTFEVWQGYALPIGWMGIVF
jgi:hypothetical protein